MRIETNCTAALLAVSIGAALAFGQPAVPAPSPGDAAFTLFIRGTPVGVEQVSVSSSADGWTIRSKASFSPPLDLVVTLFEVRYGRAWVPIELTIDAARGGQPFTLRTAFEDGTATTQMGTEAKTDRISEAPVVLPNNFFAGYEALAARLSSASPGDELPIYVAPSGELTLRVNQIVDEQLRVGDRLIAARRHRVAFLNPSGPYDAELWSDAGRRLLRLTMPLAGVDFVRSDLVSSSTRLQRFSHPGDEDVRIAAAGFSLAATVTAPAVARAAETPARSAPRWPAVVLVPGSSAEDRDHTVNGVPILGQLAGGLADRGFLVVRYEKRGVGQSGGRAEAATLSDYAEDVRAIVRYLQERKDVDRNRMAAAGYQEGGWAALAAAARERRIAALALVATGGTTGAELVLEQQRLELDRLKIPEAEREAKIALQRRIHDAVLGKASWDDIPFDVRSRADSDWFRSYLQFDPAAMMRRVRQPVLVVHGTLDRHVPPHHADRLIELARARKRSTADLARIDGVNHLLVPATTGGSDDDARREDAAVSPSVTAAIADWLARTLGPDPAQAR